MQQHDPVERGKPLSTAALAAIVIAVVIGIVFVLLPLVGLFLFAISGAELG